MDFHAGAWEPEYHRSGVFGSFEPAEVQKYLRGREVFFKLRLHGRFSELLDEWCEYP